MMPDTLGDRFLDLEDPGTREFLGRLLDLWDRSQERITYSPFRENVLNDPPAVLNLLNENERKRLSEETDRWIVWRGKSGQNFDDLEKIMRGASTNGR
jgi:hypothetical protein